MPDKKTKKEKEITVLWVPAGKPPVTTKVVASLEGIYPLVNGGPFEMKPYADNVNVVWNENATITDPPLPLNRSIWQGRYTVRGDFFFTRLSKKTHDMVGVTELDVARLLKELL